MAVLLPVLAVLILTAACVLGAYGCRMPRKRSRCREAAALCGRDQQERMPREGNASQPAGQCESEGESASHGLQPGGKPDRPGTREAGEDGCSVQQEEPDRLAGAEAASPPASESSSSPADEAAVERGADGSSQSDAAGDHPGSGPSRDQLEEAGGASGGPDTAASAGQADKDAASESGKARGTADRGGGAHRPEAGTTDSGHMHDGEARSQPAAGTQRKGAAIRTGQRPSRPASYRDARGRGRQRRPAQGTAGQAMQKPLEDAARPPAEAKLRLVIHPIQQRASLSVVLARPEGYPKSVTVRIDGQRSVAAYSEQRYDDLDLAWAPDLLAGELRLASSEGFQWVRSARQVHIFTEDPSELGLVSVGAVRAGSAHTVVCRSADAEAVQDAAAATGSPVPETNAKLLGVPDGWTLLTGYTPVHEAACPLPAGLQPLDPGMQLKIEFEGGLAVRAKAFAEGHPPRIAISAEPSGASVAIDGQPAAIAAGGGWEAPGWSNPGRHVVDVTPGPSATYEIVADPWGSQGWQFWNGHPGRFGNHKGDAWGEAEICGASIRGPGGQAVLAARASPILVALGARNGASQLRRRDGMEVSMGFTAEPPAFLLRAEGQRRAQGRVVWLGLDPAPSTAKPRRDDPAWREAVRWAAARRLQPEGGGPCAEEAWQKAKRDARRHRKAGR